MTERDPRQPVEFAPVAIRRRRRRVDPAGVGVALVAVALVVAVLKPWDGDAKDPAREAAAASPSLSTEASPRPEATDGPIPAVAAQARPTLAWSDLEAVVQPRDGWGIRTIVVTPGRSTYGERWTPMRDRPDDDPLAILQPGDQSVAAIGVTYPAGSTPLDVRVWRRSPTGGLYWVDARPIARDPARGGLLFVPPWSDPGAPYWGPGEYRIDLLVGSGDVRHVDVAIPDRYENIRPSSIDPPQVTELVTSSAADPAMVRPGMFATIDHVAVPIEGDAGPALDEAAAWLDTEPGSGRVPADHVAVATLPRATGLGVRLEDGSLVRSGSIERLAPGPFRTAPVPVGGSIIDRRDADPWVLFSARRGDAWAPGVYRINVTWSDTAGVHDASWHIELRPGPDTGPPPLLASTRAWARHAGASGLVVGRAEPLEGGPRSSAIRLLGIPETPHPSACDGTIVAGSPGALGLAYPAGDSIQALRVDMDASGAATREVPVLTVRAAVPGLALVAPTDGAAFQPGIYRLSVEDGAATRVITACVGGATTP